MIADYLTLSGELIERPAIEAYWRGRASRMSKRKGALRDVFEFRGPLCRRPPDNPGGHAAAGFRAEQAGDNIKE